MRNEKRQKNKKHILFLLHRKFTFASKRGSTIICPTSDIVCFSGIYFYILPRRKICFFFVRHWIIWISWSPDIPICKSKLVLPPLSPSFVGVLQVQCDVTQGYVASKIFGHSNFNEWFPFLWELSRFFVLSALRWRCQWESLVCWHQLLPYRGNLQLPFHSYQSTYCCPKHTYSNIQIDIKFSNIHTQTYKLTYYFVTYNFTNTILYLSVNLLLCKTYILKLMNWQAIL